MLKARKKIRQVDPTDVVRAEDARLDATTFAVARGEESFGSIVRARRLRNGMTLAEIADRIGCRKGYLSMIETGQRPPPGEHFIVELEKALEFTSGELLAAAHWATAPAVVRERFLRHVQLRTDVDSRNSSVSKRLGGLRNLDELLESGQLKQMVERSAGNIDLPRPLTKRIPIINKVAAGYPSHFTDLDYPAQFADEYLASPGGVADADSFAARVVGDSMEPVYHEGDTIIFSPDAPTPSGSDCFVRLEPDHDTTFKRVFFEGEDEMMIRLHPLNSAYQERVVHREEVAGLYAAVCVMRMIQRPTD